jgi:hypothetical protein
MTKTAKKQPPVASVPAVVKKSITVRLDESMAPEDASRITGDPVASAIRVIAKAEQPTFIGKATAGDWSGLNKELNNAIQRVAANDLRDVERMLFGQAAALQSLFVRLTEGALGAETVPSYDLKFRYALRAQSQCRATLETLAAIKNPPVVFARQANVTTGPQQVNNELARAGKLEEPPTQLSGAFHELHQNGGASAAASTTNTALAPVGAFDRTTYPRGQAQGGRKRMEGRSAARASRSRQNPQAAAEKR